MSYLIIATIVFIIGFIPYLKYETMYSKDIKFIDYLLLVWIWFLLSAMFPLLIFTLIAMQICYRFKICNR